MKKQRLPGICDRRFGWTYIFAAIEPASGDGFALVPSAVSTVSTTRFLAEFAKTLRADEHAVMVLDCAGY